MADGDAILDQLDEDLQQELNDDEIPVVTVDSSEIRSHEATLSSCCIGIGEVLEHYDAENDCMVERFEPSESCLDELQDIGRLLRKEDDEEPALGMRLCMGEWKVPQNSLIPVLLACNSDYFTGGAQQAESIQLEVIKIFVRLTMPVRPSLRGADIINRSHLRQVKDLFLDRDVLAIVLSAISDALANEGARRTPDDNAKIELVLSLLRNLLRVKNADQHTAQLPSHSQQHEALIVALRQENVLDVLGLLANLIDSSENQPFSLLVAEILSCLFQGVPTDLLLHTGRLEAKAQRKDASLTEESLFDGTRGKLKAARSTHSDVPASADRLSVMLGDERRFSQARKHRASRHSKFGGQFRTKINGRKVMYNTLFENPIDRMPQAMKRMPKTRRQGRMEAETENPMDAVRDLPRDSLHYRHRLALLRFAEGLLDTAFGRVVQAMKGAFTRGVDMRAEASQEYMHFIASMMHIHHGRFSDQVQKAQRSIKLRKHMREVEAQAGVTLDHDSEEEDNAQLRFRGGVVAAAMDLWSFGFIVRQCGTWIDEKHWNGVAATANALREMLKCLHLMYNSGDPPSLQVSKALVKAVFYQRDILEVVPRMMRQYEPQRFTHSCLSAFMETTHVILKMAELLVKEDAVVLSKRRKQKRKRADGGAESDEDAETRAEQKELARREQGFEFRRYLTDYVHNTVIKAYIDMLSRYRRNDVKVNHYVVAFLDRIMRTEIPEGGVDADNKPVTLRPQLYHITMLQVLEQITNDGRIARKSDFDYMRRFATRLSRAFIADATRCPTLFVDVLFWRDRSTNLLIARHYRHHSGEAAGGSRSSKPISATAEAQNEAAAQARIAAELRDAEAAGIIDEEEWDGTVPERPEASDAEDGVPEAAHASGDEATTSATPVAAPPARKSTKVAPWTGLEDTILTELWTAYEGLANPFEHIAADPAFAGKRTETQLLKRAETLGQVRGRAPPQNGDVLEILFTSATHSADPEEISALVAEACKSLQRQELYSTSEPLVEVRAALPEPDSLTQSGDEPLLLDVTAELPAPAAWIARHLDECLAAHSTAAAAEQPAPSEFVLLPQSSRQQSWLQNTMFTKLLRKLGYAAPNSLRMQTLWRLPSWIDVEDMRVSIASLLQRPYTRPVHEQLVELRKLMSAATLHDDGAYAKPAPKARRRKGASSAGSTAAAPAPAPAPAKVPSQRAAADSDLSSSEDGVQQRRVVGRRKGRAVLESDSDSSGAESDGADRNMALLSADDDDGEAEVEVADTAMPVDGSLSQGSALLSNGVDDDDDDDMPPAE